MSRFAVAVMYADYRTDGRTSYKLRQRILEASSTAEALGCFLIEESAKNYGQVMTYAVNHIDELSLSSESKPNE